MDTGFTLRDAGLFRVCAVIYHKQFEFIVSEKPVAVGGKEVAPTDLLRRELHILRLVQNSAAKINGTCPI